MKVYFANSSKQAIGGGWSFLANIKKGMPDNVTEDYAEATHYFISGATMVGRDEVSQAKKDGKKIILRIDNAVRNSRNRNTGMSRMYDFAQMADQVIYQSNWALNYLFPFLKVDGAVILNGVDQDIFNRTGRGHVGANFLYSRFNRDETKNWEMARYVFSQATRAEKLAKLKIVGQFSQELINGNFDFYDGEDYEYLGIISDPKNMAKIYKNTNQLIYTYFNDCMSNTLIEALCCGCEVYDKYNMSMTGGTPEILQHYYTKGDEFFSLHRMASEYRNVMESI